MGVLFINNFLRFDKCLWQVRELETDPLFNSGRGSALTEKGTVEMEASIMDGPKRRCGAVSGLTTVKNPISLARLVMDKSPHSYLAFSGAEEFARQQVYNCDSNSNLVFYFLLNGVNQNKLWFCLSSHSPTRRMLQWLELGNMDILMTMVLNN